jgi:Tat protein secretion system quality control protein TatD with DNase activity
MPADRLMIETDAPYMGRTVPGRRNDSSLLRLTAETVAALAAYHRRRRRRHTWQTQEYFSESG